MPCKRDGGAIDAALCQYDCATRRRKLPNIGQRQRHQVPGYGSGEDLVTHVADAIVHVATGYAMYGGIGSGSNSRVPHRGIRRKNTELRLSEPRPTLPQCRERWHECGVAIEVVATHAIENEQYDHARRSHTRLQYGQYTASRRWRHMHAKRGRECWRHILLRCCHGIGSGLDRGACKHQRDRDVIRPRRAVHIRDVRVGTRDEIALTRHDQKLAGASRKIGACKHVEETLSRSPGPGPASPRACAAHGLRVSVPCADRKSYNQSRGELRLPESYERGRNSCRSPASYGPGCLQYAIVRFDAVNLLLQMSGNAEFGPSHWRVTAERIARRDAAGAHSDRSRTLVKRRNIRAADRIFSADRQSGGAPGEIRTPDPLVRSQVLYPAELRARKRLIYNCYLAFPPKSRRDARARIVHGSDVSLANRPGRVGR